MAVACKDFYPNVIKSGLLSTRYESLHATVRRANEWMAREQVNLINIETVVLPNVGEGETSKAAIRTSGELSSYWFQVVRVWYEAEDYPSEGQEKPPVIES